MCPKPKIRVRIGNLPLLSNRKGDTRRQVQIDGFLLQVFHVRDLTVNVEAVTCCERTLPGDAACPYKPQIRSVEERNGIPVSQRPAE